MGIRQRHRGNEFPGSQPGVSTPGVLTPAEIRQEDSPLVLRIQGEDTAAVAQGTEPRPWGWGAAASRQDSLFCGHETQHHNSLPDFQPNSCKLCKSHHARAPG